MGMPERKLANELTSLDSNDPDFLYDERTSKFFVTNRSGDWVGLKENAFRRHLRGLAKSQKKDKDETLAELEQIVEDTELDNRVSYAGPLAGHWKGVTRMDGNDVLITVSPQLIDPQEPDEDDDVLPDGGRLLGKHDCRGWSILGQVMKNMLSHESIGDVQLERYMIYMAHVLDCLYTRQRSKIIALMVAGEVDCGKTLLFNDIHRALFGGRVGKPYDWFIGKENFNDDILGSVLLTVDDEVNNTHMEARNTLGEKLKRMVANSEHRIRGMHKSGFILQPLWAPCVMVNLEPANLLVLPPIEEDNADKFMIFKGYSQRMPMPSVSKSEQRTFWAQLMKELPKFVWWIQNKWISPRELEARFGVKHYHHPEVVEELMKLSPAWITWDLLQRTVFKDTTFHQNLVTKEMFEGNEWMGTASDLRSYLLDIRSQGEDDRPRLNQEDVKGVGNPQWLGRRIEKLSKRFPDSVKHIKTRSHRYIHLIAPLGDGSDSKRQ